MTLVIVPNELSEQLYAEVDRAIAEFTPAKDDREYLYQALLNHFHEHGVIGQLNLIPKEPTDASHVESK